MSLTSTMLLGFIARVSILLVLLIGRLRSPAPTLRALLKRDGYRCAPVSRLGCVPTDDEGPDRGMELVGATGCGGWTGRRAGGGPGRRGLESREPLLGVCGGTSTNTATPSAASSPTATSPSSATAVGTSVGVTEKEFSITLLTLPLPPKAKPTSRFSNMAVT